MQFIHWLRKIALKGSKKPQKGQRRPIHHYRLQLEALEDRVVMSTVTGTYNLGPALDGNSATQNANGSFHLVATQAGAFSYVNYAPNQIFTFAQLNTLSATFTSNAGGSGGGSPRVKVGLDDNGTETFVLIYLGAGPSYVNTSAVLNTYSGTNLIGNSEPEAYDTSAFTGGSPFTTYASADALIGALKVVEFDFVVDTFSPNANRDITFNHFSAAITDALPFSDSFSSGPTLSNSWFTEAGQYVTTSGQAVGQAKFNLAVVDGINVGDISVQALMNFTAASQYIGLVARYSGPGDNNEYLGQMSWLGGANYRATIYRISAGKATLLAGVKLTNGTGTLRFDLEGSSLKLFLNGALVLDAHDSVLATGTVGIRSAAGAGIGDFSADAIVQPVTALPFTDNFTANPPGNQLGANWLEQAGNYNVSTGAAVAQSKFNLATLTNLIATNVAVQADISFTANNQYIGLVARYSGPGDNNEYLANITRLGPTSFQATIYRIKGGVPTRLAIDNLTTGAGTLVFELAGPSLKLFLNNTLVAYAQDSALANGSAGMRTALGTSVANFSVTPITLTTPALPFSDTFSTSVNSQLSSSWVEQAGNYKVTPGTGATGQASLNEAVLNGVSVTNVTLQASASMALSTYIGLLARYTGPGDANTYLAQVVRLANGTYQGHLYKNVNGTWIQVGPTATRATFAGNLEFVLNGTSLTLDMDGTLAVTFADSSIAGAATVGMRSSAGVTISSFSAN
jgi:hypothetical protein